MSLLKKNLHISTNLYFIWTPRDIKTPTVKQKQSLESSNTGIWVGGAWVVNTPVREHNEHFRATCKSLRVSNLGLRSPRPTSLCFERDDTWKGKYWKKENKSSVLFSFFYTPMPEFLAGLGTISSKIPTAFRLRPKLKTCMSAAVFSPNIPPSLRTSKLLPKRCLLATQATQSS